MARERPTHMDAAVEPELELEPDAAGGGAVGEEGEVEPGAVPRDHDAGRQPREQLVERAEQPALGTGQHDCARRRADRGSHDPTLTGVEAVAGRVRLDVEAIKGKRRAHWDEGTPGV